MTPNPVFVEPEAGVLPLDPAAAAPEPAPTPEPTLQAVLDRLAALQATVDEWVAARNTPPPVPGPVPVASPPPFAFAQSHRHLLALQHRHAPANRPPYPHR